MFVAVKSKQSLSIVYRPRNVYRYLSKYFIHSNLYIYFIGNKQKYILLEFTRLN